MLRIYPCLTQLVRKLIVHYTITCKAFYSIACMVRLKKSALFSANFNSSLQNVEDKQQAS
jgi:hypothetical protein